MVHLTLSAAPAQSESGVRYVLNITPTRNSAKKINTEHQEYDEKLQASLSRSRKMLLDLAVCNDWDYWCTFTFSPENVDRYDFRACRKYLTKFFNNYRNRVSPGFRYLIVPERHEDKAIHFHGFLKCVTDLYIPETILKRQDDTSLIEVPNTPQYLRWKSYDKIGIINLSPVRNHFAAANYMGKYITKDLVGGADFPKGSQLILHSQGLRKPIILYNQDVLSAADWSFGFDFSELSSLSAQRKEFEYCTSFYIESQSDIEKIEKFLNL